MNVGHAGTSVLGAIGSRRKVLMLSALLLGLSLGGITVAGVVQRSASVEVRSPERAKAQAVAGTPVVDPGDSRIHWIPLETGEVSPLAVLGDRFWYSVGDVGSRNSTVYALDSRGTIDKVAELPFATVSAVVALSDSVVFAGGRSLARVWDSGAIEVLVMPPENGSLGQDQDYISSMAWSGTTIYVARNGLQAISVVDCLQNMRIIGTLATPKDVAPPTRLALTTENTLMFSTPFNLESASAGGGVLDLGTSAIAVRIPAYAELLKTSGGVVGIPSGSAPRPQRLDPRGAVLSSGAPVPEITGLGDVVRTDGEDGFWIFPAKGLNLVHRDSTVTSYKMPVIEVVPHSTPGSTPQVMQIPLAPSDLVSLRNGAVAFTIRAGISQIGIIAP